MIFNSFIISSILALIFGWLLSFPLYGPALMIIPYNAGIESMGLVFILTHLIGLLAGVFLYQKYWRLLMQIGITISLLASLLFTCVDSSLWFLGIMGFFSALAIIGWSYPFTAIINKNITGWIAGIIVFANLILLIVMLIVELLPPRIILWLVNIPLLLAAVLINIWCPRPERLLTNNSPHNEFPKKLMFYFCLVIFGLFLCGGFVYNTILPTYRDHFPNGTFPEIIYILALVLIWSFISNKEPFSLVYFGASFLGLGFVSFISIQVLEFSYYLTISMIYSALAFLDLFLWTLLSTISRLYNQPFKVFGIGLTANLAALYSGGLIVSNSMMNSKNNPFTIPLLALVAIFLVVLIIPLLNRFIVIDVIKKLKHPIGLNRTESGYNRWNVLGEELNSLTPKESEVLQLVIEGVSNKEIAERLYISENTAKVHLKNIHRKFGVSGKYELLSLILNKISSENRSNT